MLNSVNLDEKVNQYLADVAKLRRFAGAPAEFWPAFVSAAADLIGADKGILILKDQKDDNWKKLSEWSNNGHADRSILTFNRHLIEIGERTAREGSCSFPIEQTAAPDLKHFALGVKLALNRPEDLCIAAFLLPNAT
jgi:hypothetical protein